LEGKKKWEEKEEGRGRVDSLFVVYQLIKQHQVMQESALEKIERELLYQYKVKLEWTHWRQVNTLEAGEHIGGRSEWGVFKC
jgi:hypothetical protein